MSKEKDIEANFPDEGTTFVSQPAPDGEPVDAEVVIVHDTDEQGNVIGWHKEAGEAE